MLEMDLTKRLGKYVHRTEGGEMYKAYIPPRLPPYPPIDMDRLYKPLNKAMKALGGLDTLSNFLPNISLFIYMYVRKEALVSSQIEGTQSSLSDLLLFESKENPTVPVEDVEEVSNYIAALSHGMKRMKEGFPLSVRLLREVHEILLRGVRGSTKSPGNFRRSQNWIGGVRPGRAHFVPPPPETVEDLMSELEKFIHDDVKNLPVLIKAALTHVQFETIHPFLDGNGRLGRLLITLMLCSDSILVNPILYLSLYFKEYHSIYYDFLQAVRLKGDWEGWCEFFLDGVAEMATQATSDARKIIELIDKDRLRISQIGKASKSGLRIYDYLLKKPYLLITKAAAELSLSVPSTTSTIMKLVDMGILKETTGQFRNRVFAYTEYLAILETGTSPIR